MEPAYSRAHNIIILIIVTIVPDATHTSAGTKWELQWKHVRKSKGEGAQFADAVAETLKGYRTTALASTAATPAKYNKPLPLDEGRDRLKPLCKMIASVPVPNPGGDKNQFQIKTSPCSCSFIGPNLVITAAHCFTIPGVDAKWDVYIVQNYGKKGSEVLDSATRYQALEWWYPASYVDVTPETKGVLPEGRSHDFAFVKTDKPFVGVPYELMTPIGPDYTISEMAAMALGYPEDYRDTETAVSFKGKITKIDGDISEYTFLGLEGKERRGKPARLTEVGGMETGGSGGPWILRSKQLTQLGDALGKKLRMGLFCVESCGPNDAERQSNNDMKRLEYGAYVTPDLIKVAKRVAIYASKGIGQLPTAGGPVEKVQKIEEKMEIVTFKQL